MPTIGRRYHGPTRNWAEDCDVCGVKWHRHEMRRTLEGHLVCPDDAEGRTGLEITLLLAAEGATGEVVKGKTR